MSDADTLRERLSGEQMVHRLREWEDGDTLFGVASYNPDSGASAGKTYRAGGNRGGDAETRARERHDREPISGDHTHVLYRATVRNPRTEPPGPDPGEPPLKFATLADVEILDWKGAEPEDGGSDE